MGKLADGDDGLPAEEVGPWAKEKQELLGRYVDISRGARSKFIGPFKAGATYIDLLWDPADQRSRILANLSTAAASRHGAKASKATRRSRRFLSPIRMKTA